MPVVVISGKADGPVFAVTAAVRDALDLRLRT
jgi:hypothetical protein